jgi:DNA-binding NarL/FixJ family response regulator
VTIASDTPLKVMLVEDHALLRAAIRQTLSVPEVEVVGEARTGEAALELLVTVRPDVVLVDIDLPGMSGVRLVREMVPRLPDAHIIMLTASAAREDLMGAIQNGASGYLTKDLSPEALVRAVLGIRQGDLPMPRRLAAEVVRHLSRTDRHRRSGVGWDLSPREEEVLRHIAEGGTDREIAEALGISPRTIGRHVGSVLDKLGVRNRAEAARRYREES